MSIHLLAMGQMATVQAAASNWTPSNISTMTLAAWYDADDAATITATSGSVDQWSDKSGNGHHMTASTTARPTTGTRTINALNVLDFDGSANTMTSSTGWQAGSGNSVIMAVVSPDVTNSMRIVVGSASNGTRHQIARDSSGSLSFVHNGSFAQILSLGTVATAAQIVGGYKDGASSGAAGINATYTTSSSVGTAPTLDAWRLGANPNAGEFWNGMIAEVVVCLGHDLAERQKLEGYLAHKWGLAASLPGGHPYQSSAPTT